MTYTSIAVTMIIPRDDNHGAISYVDNLTTASGSGRSSSPRDGERERERLGMVYRNIGDYPRAISYHDKKLAIAQTPRERATHT